MRSLEEIAAENEILAKQDRSLRMKRRWEKIRAGVLPKPVRKSNGDIRRALDYRLDGSFGRDKNKRLVVTLHPDGRLELRPERRRHGITLMLADVYRFGIRCKADAVRREKAAKRKARKEARWTP